MNVSSFPLDPCERNFITRFACRAIDIGASTVVRLLRQYPVSRLAAAGYLLGLHLFIYLLLGRLQHHALSVDGVAAIEH